ncbi:HD-GYP domain-containing protein [Selenihalanaerobacter shriftii]|uniref:HDIG domain-containing protein n=1 Tax=Selenihalanaerobacter shriftii TaxID=142842 RepID=A0A1T4NUY4_9FIRM|nr:HD-GYP domain-containing protein [Selenihalanaerobacter shriftii]SJZ82975.1 HDIG domain-containing protein [Selenihalanaerobacter shriftii]
MVDTLAKAFIETIKLKDLYTFNHSKNVCKYSLRIGEELNLEKVTLDNLRYASLLHDIGKVSIPETILHKSTSLTEKEYIEIKKHSMIGANLLKKMNLNDEIVKGVRHHHEFINGQGYPNGLKKEGIPLIARIISIADAFDAMTSTRPYRGPLSTKKTLKELNECRGIQFDSEIVDVFINLIKKGDLLATG